MNIKPLHNTFIHTLHQKTQGRFVSFVSALHQISVTVSPCLFPRMKRNRERVMKAVRQQQRSITHDLGRMCFPCQDKNAGPLHCRESRH